MNILLIQNNTTFKCPEIAVTLCVRAVCKMQIEAFWENQTVTSRARPSINREQMGDKLLNSRGTHTLTIEDAIV